MKSPTDREHKLRLTELLATSRGTCNTTQGEFGRAVEVCGCPTTLPKPSHMLLTRTTYRRDAVPRGQVRYPLSWLSLEIYPKPLHFAPGHAERRVRHASVPRGTSGNPPLQRPADGCWWLQQNSQAEACERIQYSRQDLVSDCAARQFGAADEHIVTLFAATALERRS